VEARKEELKIKKSDENDFNLGIKEYTVQTKSKTSRESISGMGQIGLKAHPKKLNRESKNPTATTLIPKKRKSP
jgi:hypothetical protein